MTFGAFALLPPSIIGEASRTATPRRPIGIALSLQKRAKASKYVRTNGSVAKRPKSYPRPKRRRRPTTSRAGDSRDVPLYTYTHDAAERESGWREGERERERPVLGRPSCCCCCRALIKLDHDPDVRVGERGCERSRRRRPGW